MLVVTIFLAAGAAADWRSLRLRTGPRETGPEATTNAFLGVLLLRHPAATLEDALRVFPPESQLLFVGPEREAFFFQVYYTVEYLAYPRLVSAAICKDPGTPPSVIQADPGSQRFDGVVLFEAPPPAGARELWRVGSKLMVGRIADAKPWNSYCP